MASAQRQEIIAHTDMNTTTAPRAEGQPERGNEDGEDADQEEDGEPRRRLLGDVPSEEAVSRFEAYGMSCFCFSCRMREREDFGPALTTLAFVWLICNLTCEMLFIFALIELSYDGNERIQVDASRLPELKLLLRLVGLESVEGELSFCAIARRAKPLSKDQRASHLTLFVYFLL